MAQHKSFTVDTNVKVYFCDPQSPWQRGTNENTNGLLRQYFPKKTDLSGYSQADLNKVALRLNQRPRQTWAFKLRQVNFEMVLHRPVELARLFRQPEERLSFRPALGAVHCTKMAFCRV
jgi:IS30 family transposase